MYKISGNLVKDTLNVIKKGVHPTYSYETIKVLEHLMQNLEPLDDQSQSAVANIAKGASKDDLIKGN